MSAPNAIVVGAGVAGLTTALNLRRIGWEVRVWESAPALRATGGALLLWSNAMKALELMGLAEEIARRGTILEDTEIRSWNGDTLWRLPVQELSLEAEAPTVLISRTELLDVLLEALGSDTLEVGRRFDGAVEHAHAVVVRSEDGREEASELLVGADGIGSAVRSWLRGDEALRPLGQVAWVGIAEYEHLLLPPGVSIATAGEGLRFWSAALPGGRIYWYATVGESRSVRSIDELARCFRDAHEPLAELVRATSPSQIVRTRIHDRVPSRGWSSERTVLVGDAAHACTPDLGQGACQAIESALEVADCLARIRCQAEALAVFEATRFERCARVTELSYATAVASGSESRILMRLRDFGVRAWLPSIALPSLRWLLGGGSRVV
jgi:2-polyprenyl-6-methoxyphenol hydroxylase-like FAD-dependent oxidoreductase